MILEQIYIRMTLACMARY